MLSRAEHMASIAPGVLASDVLPAEEGIELMPPHVPHRVVFDIARTLDLARAADSEDGRVVLHPAGVLGSNHHHSDPPVAVERGARHLAVAGLEDV